jgi:hypothetical protein
MIRGEAQETSFNILLEYSHLSAAVIKLSAQVPDGIQSRDVLGKGKKNCQSIIGRIQQSEGKPVEAERASWLRLRR